MIPNTGQLVGRTLFITGASRGIGKAIALKAAKDGANIVVAAKTAEPHPKLPGTIYTAAKEIEDAGGKALPCIVDVRDEASVEKAINDAVKKFGGLDVIVNNASAISLTKTELTSMKKYDLMHQINTRGTYLVSKLGIPHLAKSSNPHILNISPPLNMNPRWFKDHVAYTMAKYGMSMCVLGMAEELKPKSIACNALWPRTAIITAAMEMLGGKESANYCRKPEIMADAAYTILCKDSKSFTGNFVVDDEILKEAGIQDFSSYAFDPKCTNLLPDYFLDEFDDAASPDMLKSSIENNSNSTQDTSSSEDTSSPVSQLFSQVGAVIDEQLVEKTQAVYLFDISGDEKGHWYLDLKEGKGKWGKGEPPSSPDATLIMKAADLIKMFQGTLKPTVAFMTGKLKVSGDTSKALKLEKMLSALRPKL